MSVKRVQRLGDVGELSLIDWIRRNMPGNVSGLLRGIGDDAAVLRGGEIISTDMLVEGIHFVRKWHDPFKLGRKSLSVNLSDLAAMGGEPRCAFMCLAIRSIMPLNEVEAFFSGFAQVAREHGMAVAGGDLSGTPGPMIIAVTVVGRADRPVLRSGARPGDALFVTGTIGDSSLALKFLQKKGPLPGGKHFKYLLARHLDPTPRINIGRRVAQFASAMIDLSDGLAVDLNNLCRESGTGARISLNKLPLSDAYKFQKGRIKKKNDPLELYHEALYGGEDYELLFAVPPTLKETMRQIGEAWPVTEIGEIVEADKGVMIESPKGTIPLAPKGDFAHFKSG